MRISSTIVALLTADSRRTVKKRRATHSELLHVILRRFLDAQKTIKAVVSYKQEQETGKLRVLKGSLVDLY